MLLKRITKAFNKHPEGFQKYHIMVSDIVSKIAATYVNTRSVSDSKGLNKLVQSLVSNGSNCNLS